MPLPHIDIDTNYSFELFLSAISMGEDGMSRTFTVTRASTSTCNSVTKF